MLFAIIARLRKLNPAARLLTTHRNEATAERLFTMGLFDPSKKTRRRAQTGWRPKPMTRARSATAAATAIRS